MKTICIASFPRSGNHLLRCVLEFVTNTTSEGVTDNDVSIMERLQKAKLLAESTEEEIRFFSTSPDPGLRIWKTHNPKSIQIMPKDTLLIFISRDPVEAIASEIREVFQLKEFTSDDDHTEENFHSKWPCIYRILPEKCALYQSLFEAYHAYEGEKMHVRYEDIVQEYKPRVWEQIMNHIHFTTENPLEKLSRNFSRLQQLTTQVLLRPGQSFNNLTFYQDKYPFLKTWSSLTRLGPLHHFYGDNAVKDHNQG